ncbi:MAG: hypothetical protein Q8Q48_01740 [Candidatus Staskawiczbacteria bacterium]|nr:hypothetical protein [Candidatus Staskawiczbacteria bacterium]
MKKIGEGWQYKTYDLGNGRVLKKFHSIFGLYWTILREVFPFKDDPIWNVPSFVKSSKRKALHSFEILKIKQIPGKWLGNPRFLDNLDYEQDKVTPLHDIFDESNTEQIKLFIDLFVKFNKQLMETGVIDKSFNITKNYGLNENGEIVLIDLGELFDDPQRIRKQFKDRAWDKSYVSGRIQDLEARDYFIKQMNENFGLE